MTYPSAVGSARVEREKASDPAPGSVVALPPMSEPLQRPGRYRFFCYSLPCFQMGTTQENRWAQTEKTRPTSASA